MPANQDQTVLRMGALTQLTGVSDQTVRLYERLGLLHAVGRTQGGFRTFHPDTVARIQFIRRAQQLGLSLEAIGTLLQVERQHHPTCTTAQTLMADQLAALDREIQRLEASRAELLRLSRTCLTCEGPCGLAPTLLEAPIRKPPPE